MMEEAGAGRQREIEKKLVRKFEEKAKVGGWNADLKLEGLPLRHLSVGHRHFLVE